MNFSVEEENLICMYHTSDRRRTMARMLAALPDMNTCLLYTSCMAKRLSRIERDIERLKEKSAEYQQQLKELEAAKTEQENLQIIQLVRSMNMKPDEFAAFLRSGALNAAPTATPYHKQEDAADET